MLRLLVLERRLLDSHGQYLEPSKIIKLFPVERAMSFVLLDVGGTGTQLSIPRYCTYIRFQQSIPLSLYSAKILILLLRLSQFCVGAIITISRNKHRPGKRIMDPCTMPVSTMKGAAVMRCTLCSGFSCLKRKRQRINQKSKSPRK